MAPIQLSVSGSRLAERWFALSQRNQLLQPLEGSSSLPIRDEDRSKPAIVSRSLFDDTSATSNMAPRASSTPPKSFNVSTAALIAVIGGAIAVTLAFFLWRWWKARNRDPYDFEEYGTTSTEHTNSVQKSSIHTSSDPFRAHRPQPSLGDTNAGWTPQYQPATWMRPLSIVYKKEQGEKRNLPEDAAAPQYVHIRAHPVTIAPSIGSTSEFLDSLPNLAYKAKPSDHVIALPPSAHVSGSPPLPVMDLKPTARYSVIIDPPSRPATPNLPAGSYAEPNDPAAHVIVTVHLPKSANTEEAQSLSEDTSAQGQEFEIPDFKYSVPHTPRFTSLPKSHQQSLTSSDAPKHHFPPTPPSVAARYGHSQAPSPTTMVVVSETPVSTQSFAITSSSTKSPSWNALPRLVKVVGTFPKSLPDELALTLGETLRLLHVFPDDWCIVQRLYPSATVDAGLTEQRMSVMETGAVPTLCLTEVGGGRLVKSSSPTSEKIPTSAPASITSSAVVSEKSGRSGASGASSESGQTGATESTDTTTATKVSERSHWSSATTNVTPGTAFTSPGSERVIKSPGSGVTMSPTSSDISGASGQSLIVPPGLAHGYITQQHVPAALSNVAAGKQQRIPPPYAASSLSDAQYADSTLPNLQRPYALGMRMRNGSFSSLLDRTRAS